SVASARGSPKDRRSVWAGATPTAAKTMRLTSDARPSALPPLTLSLSPCDGEREHRCDVRLRVPIAVLHPRFALPLPACGERAGVRGISRSPRPIPAGGRDRG